MNKKPEKESPSKTQEEDLQDLVDQEGDESFPASDPPSWTLGNNSKQKK